MSLFPLLLAFLAPFVPQEKPVALERSPLAAPLYFGEAPPEARAARLVRVGYRGSPQEDPRATRSLEEARQHAAETRRRWVEGLSFGRVRALGDPTRVGIRGELGTVTPGVLEAPLDRFLFSAAEGDVSEPLVTDRGVVLVQRVARFAGCRQIFLRGSGAEVEERAKQLLGQLRAGADFRALAREQSEDPASRARGGDYRVFERGARDRLLKGAVFAAEPGVPTGPVASPLGLHLLVRVAPEELPRELWENNWIRARAVVLAHGGSTFVRSDRSPMEARDLIHELHDLARHRGQGLAALAAKHTDEPGGREREGDLGWLHRKNPGLLRELDALFLVPPGTLLEPFGVPEAWVLLERTR